MSEEKQSTNPDPTKTVDQTVAAEVEAIESEPAAELTLATDAAADVTAASVESTESTETASQQIFKDLVSKLKELWQKVSSNEQKPKLNTIAIAVLVILSLILASKILEIVDNAPLLEPLFELIGIGYSIWFVWRYLLFANTRQELVDNVKGIKSKILG
jgi:hypothetical protein